MCLFAIDGTWSAKFNNQHKGSDATGRSVGKREENVRSNTRRFFEECGYKDNKKFYFAGPVDVFGADSLSLYYQVLRVIEREINSGNCTEIVLVGWSRGAAIASELTEGLGELAQTNRRLERFQTPRGILHRNLENVIRDGKLPPIRYVGLFDSVAMITNKAEVPHDEGWAEEIAPEVQYFAHVVAGDRNGPLGIDFHPADPLINAPKHKIFDFSGATHSGVGGEDHTVEAQISYCFIRDHATLAGVP